MAVTELIRRCQLAVLTLFATAAAVQELAPSPQTVADVLQEYQCPIW